jgi:hypothetical protein
MMMMMMMMMISDLNSFLLVASRSFLLCEICGSQSSVVEELSLLEYYALSTGKKLPTLLQGEAVLQD